MTRQISFLSLCFDVFQPRIMPYTADFLYHWMWPFGGLRKTPTLTCEMSQYYPGCLCNCILQGKKTNKQTKKEQRGEHRGGKLQADRKSSHACVHVQTLTYSTLLTPEIHSCFDKWPKNYIQTWTIYILTDSNGIMQVLCLCLLHVNLGENTLLQLLLHWSLLRSPLFYRTL